MRPVTPSKNAWLLYEINNGGLLVLLTGCKELDINVNIWSRLGDHLTDHAEDPPHTHTPVPPAVKLQLSKKTANKKIEKIPAKPRVQTVTLITLCPYSNFLSKAKERLNALLLRDQD